MTTITDKLYRALSNLHSCHRAFSSNENWTVLDDEAREQAEEALEEYEAARYDQVRAAVAELIERERVMREALASVKQWNDVSGLDDEWPIVMGQVDAALARVGGAS